MKRFTKMIYITLVCLLVLVFHATAAETEYKSEISPEKCFLCGDQSHQEESVYWGQDNVGLAHLNTFDVLPLRINRYDDSGVIIREEFGILESDGLYRDDTYANSMTDPDRGYCSIQITKVKYKIDRKAVQTHLCEDCIQTMNCVYWSEEEPPEFAIINFNDRTIQPLDRALTWFFSGNFGIDCEYKENGDINLLIAYLPPRWAACK